jgi:hypothetical protein
MNRGLSPEIFVLSAGIGNGFWERASRLTAVENTAIFGLGAAAGEVIDVAASFKNPLSAACLT